MKRILFVLTLLSLLVLAPPAAAHNTYPTDDGKFLLVLGDQNEPMYTWKWTGLDLFVRVNGTNAPVTGVEETLNATLIAPGGEELSLPLGPQFASPGAYQFVEGYLYTQPGLYKVRLEGDVNGTPVSGTFDMPGPREAMQGFTFPDENVTDLLGLQAQLTALEAENRELRDRLDELEADLQMLDAHMEAMMEGGMGGGMDHGEDDEVRAPFAGPPLVLGALALALVVSRRRA